MARREQSFLELQKIFITRIPITELYSKDSWKLFVPLKTVSCSCSQSFSFFPRHQVIEYHFVFSILFLSRFSFRARLFTHLRHLLSIFKHVFITTPYKTMLKLPRRILDPGTEPSKTNGNLQEWHKFNNHRVLLGTSSRQPNVLRLPQHSITPLRS